MHTRRFLSYHAAGRFQDRSILFLDDEGDLAAVFPAAEIVENGQSIWKSHPGASYGGLVVREDYSAWADELVEHLVQYGRERQFDAIWLRTTERVFHRRACDDLDAAMFRAGFTLLGRELSTACCLSSPDEAELLARFHLTARQSVHCARRHGVTASVCYNFAAFWELLQVNLESRHGVKPTHSLDEIERLRHLVGDRMLLVGGFLDERMIAGVLIFIMNDVAAHTMYIAQDYDFNRFRALNLVVHQALFETRAIGLNYLNFGISTIPGTLGMKLNKGLHAFKRRCGGDGVFRDIWQLQISQPKPTKYLS